jgi:copper homeostasis protein
MQPAPQRRRITVELCCGGVRDALLAASSGAARIELCQALELGGLTPSPATVELACQRQPLPVMAMNRPRAGGFHYDPWEQEVLLRDAQLLVRAGAAGVVVGCLTADGQIDVAACRQLRQAIGPAEAIFHKAFDYVSNFTEALEQLIELGFQRVLTSGGAQTAMQGAEVIAQLQRQAAGRIEILPGGGVNADQVSQLLAATGCDQVHVGLAQVGGDLSVQRRPDLPLYDLRSLDQGGYRRVDADRLARLIKAVRDTTG